MSLKGRRPPERASTDRLGGRVAQPGSVPPREPGPRRGLVDDSSELSHYLEGGCP